ncbi:hypothetical protein HanPI659440_Chr10g0371691 [Helianthus annuus]|nr:hypothetical protein HanPI659440_Chr10g0371691 [Helianthus annuus]
MLKSADSPTLGSKQDEGRQLTEEEVKEKEAEFFKDTIMKMGLKEDSSSKLQSLFVKLLNSPASSNTATGMIDNEKQELTGQETAEDIAAANKVIEEAFKRMSESLHVFSRPLSLNSLGNKSLPRNPLGFKILKWMSDQKTHVLTLVRANGEVKHISRKEALGLSVQDLQDLLELSLCRDEDDQSAKEFEAEFKEQAKALLMSNKGPE